VEKRLYKENLTPAMRQWKKFKDEHPDKIIFFRMGDFYEVFGEDAVTVAPILEVVLTTRDRDTKDPLPMCGVPHHAIEVYLQKLLRAGLKGVIVEQVEDPKKAKGIVKREVTRILTPGTVLEDNLVEKEERVLIASYYCSNNEASLTTADLSKGELKIATGERGQILDQLFAINPKELLLIEGEKEDFSRFYITPLSETFYDLKKATEKIANYFSLPYSLPGIPASETARKSLGAMLFYLEDQKAPPLDFPLVEDFFGKLMIDEATRRNLELLLNLEDGTKEGTLIKCIDACQTPMGKRLLSEVVLSPNSKCEEIKEVQKEIKDWLKDTQNLKLFRKSLTNFADWARVNARFGAKIATPKDAYALKEVLIKLNEAVKYSLQIEGAPKEKTLKIPSFEKILKLLEETISDNPPISTKEGGIFKTGFNQKLDELRELYQNAHKAILKLEATERERSGIPSLKIKYNKIFGYFIEITKANLEKVPEGYERKQTLVNAERFVTKEIRELETKILSAKEESFALEEELWLDLCRKIEENLKDLREGARILAELDLYSSLAFVTYERGYTIPEFVEENVLEIEEGRHPVLERDPKHQPFVPNSVKLDNYDRQLIILTGPNMGGKSTYLRQVALLVIMAHIGMGIPAKKAKIGVVDRIFCRVGASDNLRRGLSTFMVEMTEASAILRNATRKSLVLLDEIGRGTSTYDGLSLAWAIGEALAKEGGIGCRTLFATHYHELTELAKNLSGVHNLTMGVREYGGKVYFLRTVEEGSADRSYGIHVAELAGIPKKVVERARKILEELEKKKPQSLEIQKKNLQPTLFEKDEKIEELIEKLQKLDIQNTTPLQALSLLEEIKKLIE
jgi:DNA mismatch repair protein MutS